VPEDTITEIRKDGIEIKRTAQNLKGYKQDSIPNAIENPRSIVIVI
jgi:hypothetical protein